MENYERLTLDLLKRSFPCGLADDEYFAVMAVLCQHMSLRNLTDVLTMFTERDHAIVANDVYGAYTRVVDAALLGRVTRRLEESGLERWIQEA